MDKLTYNNSATYSPEQVHNAMQDDWLYLISGGAFSGAKGRQIQSQMNQANEFDLQARMNDYANWYNSPENQIGLRMDAGIGVGSGIETFGAAGGSAPTANPQAGDLGSIIGTTAQTVSTLVQGFQFFTSAIGRINEIKESAFETANNASDTILAQLMPYTPSDGNNLDDITNKRQLRDALKTADGFVGDFMRSLPTNRHRRFMKKRLESLYNTDYHKEIYHKQKHGASKEYFDYIKTIANDLNQGDFDQVFTAYNELSKLYIDAEKKVQTSIANKGKYEGDYYGAMDGKKQANSQDFDASLKGTVEEFVNKCTDAINRSDLKPGLKSVASILIYFLASRLVNGQVSVSSGNSKLGQTVIKALL